MDDKLPKELVLDIFDRVTQQGDFATRLKMLLVFPFLWGYSHTQTHLKIIFQRWHNGGCNSFKHKVERPLPLSLSREWLDSRIQGSKAPTTKISYPAFHPWLSTCSFCGGTVCTLCTLM